jgi:hypothetical protein
MTPELKFELELRSFIEASLQGAKPSVNFNIHPGAYAEGNRRGIWTVGSKYATPPVEAQGEILSEVVAEWFRRSEFKSTLLLIEAEAEASPPASSQASPQA